MCVCGAGSRARTRFCIQCGTSSHVLSARSSSGCTTVPRDADQRRSKPRSECPSAALKESHERTQQWPAQGASCHRACSMQQTTCKLATRGMRTIILKRAGAIATHQTGRKRSHTVPCGTTHARTRTGGRKETWHYLRGLDCVAEEVELVDQPALSPELLHGHKTAKLADRRRSLITVRPAEYRSKGTRSACCGRTDRTLPGSIVLTSTH